MINTCAIRYSEVDKVPVLFCSRIEERGVGVWNSFSFESKNEGRRGWLFRQFPSKFNFCVTRNFRYVASVEAQSKLARDPVSVSFRVDWKSIFRSRRSVF